MTCPHNHRSLHLDYPPGYSASDFTNLDSVCIAAGCFCLNTNNLVCNLALAGLVFDRFDTALYDYFHLVCMRSGLCQCQELDASFALDMLQENFKPRPNQPIANPPGGNHRACLAGPGDGWCIPESNGCCDEYTCVPHHSKSLSIQFGIKATMDWLYGSCISGADILTSTIET